MIDSCPPLLDDVTPKVSISLTICAVDSIGEIVPPRTKKNSPQLIPHMKRPILVPSEAYRLWERSSLAALKREGIIRREKVNGELVWIYNGQRVEVPVNCRALIYRDKLTGDSCGFYQAIGDMLEVAGIIENDRLITQWDGTRLLKDAARPRIELTLEEVR